MYHSISLEQKNGLRLSAEMKLGIQIFGMSAVELSQFVQNALRENPLLCLDEHEADPFGEEALPASEDSGPPEALDYTSVTALADRLERRRPVGSHSEHKQRQDYSFEQFFTERPSLKSHLEDQVRFDVRTPGERLAASYLIGNIDSNGYLRITVGEAARCLNQAPEEVERMVGLLQLCQPTGVAARDLGECLWLQLQARGEDSALAQKVVEDHLGDIASGSLCKVADRLGAPIGEIQRIVGQIRALNPRPGLSFCHEADGSVIPEVSVRLRGKEILVELFDLGIPQLALEQSYLDLMGDSNTNKETQAYLRENLKAAKALMTGVERRQATLHSIACCIMRSQAGFLAEGLRGMRPLTMSEIAGQAGVSESTVSRIVNGNYIQTPHGVFELRSFFPSPALRGAPGGPSSLGAKQAIKALVDSEDKSRPFSDSQIVELLAGQGVEVSRRTVNKYRNVLGIPGSASRQRDGQGYV
ncbi:MAG: RNA polymerase factor sigma-54 [Eggerthellaceae bacterium]|nr:RNA polymerase factor sigma-54 [Eggerthellaceae bacterium]